jgi:hypothetical protein
MAHSWYYHGYQKITNGTCCRKGQKTFAPIHFDAQEMEIPQFLVQTIASSANMVARKGGSPLIWWSSLTARYGTQPALMLCGGVPRV